MNAAPTSLIVLKLKERIIKNLGDRYHKTGMNDAVPWRGVWIELGVTEEDFCKALKAGAGSDGPAEIVFLDSDHIKLGSKTGFNAGIERAGRVILKPDASEQIYSLAVRFTRFVLHFVKEKPGRFELSDASSKISQD
ncbi:MAG: hypothetical protein ACREP3_02870 [Candidatus Binatia bacterium]